MIITRELSDPSLLAQAWHVRWGREDDGLFTCWERGRAKSKEDPELADAALRGELVVLPWKGGVEKATKQAKRYGTLRYLAMWQGLRGESLYVDTSTETLLTCARTGMTVTFTADMRKYSQEE